MLAQTAWALKEFQNRHKKAKRFVGDVLTAGNESLHERFSLYEDMVRRAVDLVFDLLPRAAGLPAAEDVFELLWPVRALACLMCKEPSKHQIVRDQCLNSILRCGRAGVRDEIRHRMGWAFPEEWPDLGPGETGEA